MGDEYEDDTSDDGSVMQTGQQPLAVLASLGNSYTSQEAHDLAKKAYEDLNRARSDIDTEQDDITDDMRKQAEDAKTQLRAARDRLLQRKFDQSEKWLALAEALGAPTRSGSFGETIGNVAHEMRGVNADRRKFQ